ncbi:MAG TPA: HEAT repeat domain-containing protein [Spirochaetota bacterium]|nr:HEAT repeat domain-containing protein [Spirochaetota bacterium]HPS85321.1 HEAT repeat domain-containing protein [Spirochaetota bacterium]
MFIKPNVEKIKIAGQIDKLVKLLKHRKSQTRIEVLNALFEIAGTDKEIIEKMRPALSDKNTNVRHRATLIFARMSDTGIIDNLTDIISRGTVNEQIEVLRLLPHYYTKENEKITQILALALKDKKTSVQIEAIKSIGEMEIETMAFYLMEFANHSVSRFRYEIVYALGKVKNPIGVDVLIGALTDSSPDVRKLAEESLKKIGTDRALGALKDAPFMLMVKNMNESVSKRLTTVTNIGKQKKEYGLPLLHKACFDEYKSIRLEAIKSLSLLRDNSSIATLIELLSDKYYDVRIEAIRSLSRFNSLAALNALKNARNDPNTNVKLEAKKAYAALSSRMNIFDKGES